MLSTAKKDPGTFFARATLTFTGGLLISDARTREANIKLTCSLFSLRIKSCGRIFLLLYQFASSFYNGEQEGEQSVY